LYAPEYFSFGVSMPGKRSLKVSHIQWLEDIQIDLTTLMKAVEKSVSRNVSRCDRVFEMRAEVKRRVI
jgi:hypothetical protein